jgi:hypothetical protein
MKFTHGAGTRPVEQLGGYLEDRYSPSILVDADVVAARSWLSLVEATQADFCERGVVVAKKSGKFITSKVFEGWIAEVDENQNETDPGAFRPPLLPFGLRSLSPALKEQVLVHTHPITPELEHLKTTVLTDKDVHILASHCYNGLVMLDRGGAHLLARSRGEDWGYDSLLNTEIVNDALKQVKAQSGGSMDVIALLAQQLHNHGLSYFHTPDLSQEGQSVEFMNMRTGV